MHNPRPAIPGADLFQPMSLDQRIATINDTIIREREATKALFQGTRQASQLDSALAALERRRLAAIALAEADSKVVVFTVRHDSGFYVDAVEQVAA